MAGDKGHSQNVGKLWSEDQVVGKRWSYRFTITGKSSGNGRPNGQVVENGERNVGTCARTYVGNCGNRLKTGYTVKNWLSVKR